MKNKGRLDFDMLEQEMEVFSKDEQRVVLGSYESTGYIMPSSTGNWEQMMDAITSGDYSQIPQGTYYRDDNREFKWEEGFSDYSNIEEGYWGFDNNGDWAWNPVDNSYGNNDSFSVWSGSNDYFMSSNPPRTDCVFQCIAFIGSFYGDQSFTLDSLKNNYDSIYAEAIRNGSITPAADGVNEGLLTSFVDQYFNRLPISTFCELDSFLQGDNFAIGEILKYSADGTRSTPHAVVLTAAENGSYYCTDPQNGNTSFWIAAGELQNVAAITGLCH